MNEKSVRVATTSQFIQLEIDSRTRNRGPNEILMNELDPDGLHVAGFQLIHNDVEFRTQWFVKLKDCQEPAIVWMDNGFEEFEKNTFLHKISLDVSDYINSNLMSGHV